MLDMKTEAGLMQYSASAKSAHLASVSTWRLSLHRQQRCEHYLHLPKATSGPPTLVSWAAVPCKDYCRCNEGQVGQGYAPDCHRIHACTYLMWASQLRMCLEPCFTERTCLWTETTAAALQAQDDVVSGT